MTEHLLDVKIVQAGHTTGQYYALDSTTLRLEKVIYPEKVIPFDVGILPTALTPFDEPYTVLVPGKFSHPINTQIECRLIGALQRQLETPFLLAVPTADEKAPQSLNELTTEQLTEFTETLNRSRPGKWRWLKVDEMETQLHIATLRYRQKQADGNHREVDPAWKPMCFGDSSASFTEVERYTPAEYTFYELPHHFQHYVSEYLAADERILYAVRRPAMFSQRKRTWLNRENLQEGVLILTNQRLIHLAELLPLGTSNIRYGFHTAVGVLERLAGVTFSPFGKNFLLRTEWSASSGNIFIEWEVADHVRDSLEELVMLLRKFRANADDCALRRATPPAPPKKLPRLTDLASNDPQSLISINERYHAALAESLFPCERVHAWALLPQWFDSQKDSQVLVVTERRMFLLPDRSFDIPLKHISTLEYTGSILRSSLAVNFMNNGIPHSNTILFPYPAENSFRNCFEAARRCMAILPLA
jgi:inorganic pyrophosphatase